MEFSDVRKPPKTAMLRQWVVVVIIVITLAKTGESKCAYKAIFNFGDSNSDTGGFWAAFPAQNGPNGMTFFNHPAGRACDGRLVIDFIAQAFGLPYLDPYLKSIGSDFRHGSNFATLASTVHLPQTSLFVSGLSPFSLAIQLNQMKQFKLQVDQLTNTKENKNLPPSDIFGKSLYTIYIGQNDFTSNLAKIGIIGVKRYLPEIVSQIFTTVKELYGIGGRAFWVFNLAPIGCYPSFLVELPHTKSDIDEFGCMKSYNNAVLEYNKMLKESVDEIRQELSDAELIYVDIHLVLLHLFQHPTSHGLKYGTRACCGYGGGNYNFDPQLFCGNKKIINGRNVKAEACSDVYNYVSWDGVHTTEAANKIMTSSILSGSYFHPHFPLHNLCNLKPIG